jgi:hypothetical protein
MLKTNPIGEHKMSLQLPSTAYPAQSPQKTNLRRLCSVLFPLLAGILLALLMISGARAAAQDPDPSAGEERPEASNLQISISKDRNAVRPGDSITTSW